MCKTYELGGLGIKDVELLNTALLYKWKLRILKEQDSLLSNILRSWYGNIENKVLVGDNSVLKNKDSIWWRDLIILNGLKVTTQNQLVATVLYKVKNGSRTAFWHANWIGNQPLRSCFPEIYINVVCRFCRVAEVGVWVGPN